jgi:hypothetical protein
MLRGLLPSLLLTASLAATPSCGGKSSGNGGGNCPRTMPCGGQIQGTWDITSSCATGAPVMTGTGCPGETVALTSLNDTGSLTFNPNGTYMATLNTSGQEAVTIPVSCLSAGGTTTPTCDQFAMALTGALARADGGAVSGSTSATCTTSGANCNCNLTFSLPGLIAMGTYVASGTGVTVTPNGGAPTTDGYCVQGNTLTLFSAGGTMMSMPPADLILTKR